MSTFARKPDESSELQAADPRLDLWFSQRGRRWDFSRMELEELVQALAARPHLWEHLVKHSTSERFYVQLHLDDTLEVWLICWSQQQDTGFHDHNGSRGAVGDRPTDRWKNAGWHWAADPHLRSCTAADQCSRSAQATSTTSVRAVPPSPRRFTPTRPRWVRWVSTSSPQTACSRGAAATREKSSADFEPHLGSGSTIVPGGSVDGKAAMTRWTPDPTFYPSPRMAQAAPRGGPGICGSGRSRPDRPGRRIGGDRSRPALVGVRQHHLHAGDARHRRRTAPLRLERVQRRAVPLVPASPRRAPLSARPRACARRACT